MIIVPIVIYSFARRQYYKLSHHSIKLQKERNFNKFYWRLMITVQLSSKVACGEKVELLIFFLF